MSKAHCLTLIAGALFVLGYVPYIHAIFRGETKPAKASWAIWASLDTVTLAGMFFKNAINGQIVGAVLGAWTVAILALKYGTPGWTKFDKQCLGGALLGIVLWLAFDEANFGIVVSNIVVLLGAIPTFRSAWADPSRENKAAWTIFWLSCVVAVFAIPALTVADALQPAVFLLVETAMMYIVYIRAKALAHVRQASGLNNV
jgi:hypothetical protein